MHTEEDFFFDDFFVSQDEKDPGKLLEVEIRGRNVPLFVKRGLNFSDREVAKAQSVKTRIKPDGKVEIVSIDDGVFAIELLARTIRKWPFKYRDGSPVDITRENIKLMLADGVDALAKAIVGQMQNRQEARAPFTPTSEKNSDEA